MIRAMIYLFGISGLDNQIGPYLIDKRSGDLAVLNPSCRPPTKLERIIMPNHWDSRLGPDVNQKPFVPLKPNKTK